MNANQHQHRLPRNLQCPHCGGQMNLTGRGKAPASVMYLCANCVPVLRTKELWLGQVVRTGNQEFGFVQLHGPHAIGGIHFRYCDFTRLTHAASDHRIPRVGESVLVLLGDDPRHAERVWQMKAPTANGPNGKPQRYTDRANGKPTRDSNGSNNNDANGRGRRSGSITKIAGVDWGFITEFETGRELFVHLNDMKRNGRLTLGRRVSYLPAKTPKGWRACEVE